jgi:GxxExxY protein
MRRTFDPELVSEPDEARSYPEKELTEKIIGAAIDVHRSLGPGLLESIYEQCLAYELTLRGLQVERQIDVPVVYKERKFDGALRIDLIVNGSVIIELKSCERLAPVHEAQLLSYLRLSGRRVGLLINFNVARLKDGIIRRVL